MKLKKLAVRGLVGVLVFVALCMFFSGTIENITTPKVKLTKASRGRLEQRVELSGVLTYPDAEEQRQSVTAGQTLTITRVDVREGFHVEAGDTVIEACVTGFDAAVDAAQAEYDAALDALLECERKNGSVTLRRSEQTYADTYAALRTAVRAASAAKTDMLVAMNAAGLQYSETGYPEGADEELTAMIDAYRTAAQQQTAAQSAFDAAARYGVDDTVWAYITEKQSAGEKVEETEAKLVQLKEQNASVKAITAPHAGYIASVAVKAGDSYDGSTVLYSLTPESLLPVLRADLSGVTQNVAEGNTVEMTATQDYVLETKVSAVGFTETGARYADIDVTDEMISARGSLYSMASQENKLTLVFKARESSCLVPSSAVRGSEKDRYVYVTNESMTAFGKKKLSLDKVPVTVLAEGDGVISVQEDVSYYNIAYMEDRAVSEGSAVMAYES